ncbi:MAG TPA: recombinase family protein [Terriglobia bacterium]|nr:recombinase family protein [Terriglobia bacterium]
MQEERGLSIPEQLREIREYAQTRGIEIVGEFTEAESAFQHRAKRPEFERMLARARAERVSMILVHDFSRFSRDSVGAKTLNRQLRGAGIKVVSLNDPELDPETPAGVYLEAITFAKNEAYSREVAFHTRKGCRANVQARDPETGCCYKNGGQPPWGYRSLRLERGQDKRGRPIIKSVWTLDGSIIAGRPTHESGGLVRPRRWRDSGNPPVTTTSPFDSRTGIWGSGATFTMSVWTQTPPNGGLGCHGSVKSLQSHRRAL